MGRDEEFLLESASEEQLIAECTRLQKELEGLNKRLKTLKKEKLALKEELRVASSAGGSAGEEDDDDSSSAKDPTPAPSSQPAVPALQASHSEGTFTFVCSFVYIYFSFCFLLFFYFYISYVCYFLNFFDFLFIRPLISLFFFLQRICPRVARNLPPPAADLGRRPPPSLALRPRRRLCWRGPRRRALQAPACRRDAGPTHPCRSWTARARI